MFLVLDDPDSFEYWSDICRMSFTGNCLKFPHDQANVIGFRRKITEVNSYPYYTITKVYIINTMYHY